MNWHLLPAASGWLQALRGLRRRRAEQARGGPAYVASSTGVQAPGPVSASVESPGVRVPRGADRLTDTRNDLRRLLDRHVATRTVWPSLALIERAMGRHGWAGIDRMSPQVLHDAATVLDELMDERCDSGVIVLRARIATLLDVVFDDPSIARPRHKARRPAETQVREGSYTEFMEIDREWEQQLRAAPGAAPPR